ncbi:CHAT domain-containing protein [Streptomyces sp. P1-3]|uniref:CHAT domain-containing protein n=1 Tax=Streptomyces sp. P1-3 TaxID=3421658 RepID=UPI003D361342
MPITNRDLATLLQELQQAGASGPTHTQDMGRFVPVICERLGCANAQEAFDRLYAGWRALPDGTADSGMFAGNMLYLMPYLQPGEARATARHQEELLLAALTHGPAEPQWQAGVLTSCGAFAVRVLVDAEPAVRESALSRLEEARDMLPADHPMRDVIGVFHALLRAQLSAMGSGTDDLDSAIDDLSRLYEESAVLPVEGRSGLARQIAVLRGQQAFRRRDASALHDVSRELESILAALPDDHMDRPLLTACLAQTEQLLQGLGAQRAGRLPSAPGTAAAEVPVDEVRRWAAAYAEDDRATHLGIAGGTRLTRALLARDPQAAADGLGLMQDAVELLDVDDERWLRFAAVIGGAHLALALLPGMPAADRPRRLEQGISWLSHTHRLAAGPEHPLWGVMGVRLAYAYRIRGDHLRDARAARRNHQEARRVGFDALSGITWGVLLQSGTPHAADSGREAAEFALELARWSVADGVYDEAVRALDAGRGLLLHAATVSARVPEMLASLGHRELAEEWRSAGPVDPDPVQEMVVPDAAGALGPSSRLRRRVLDALSASPHRPSSPSPRPCPGGPPGQEGPRLLEPPTTGEIGAALRTMGAAALVYLVPGGPLTHSAARAPGSALIVSADGSVRNLPLPGLAADAAPLAEYRATGAPGRDMGGPPAGRARPRLAGRAALERLCDWAGEAVMGPLLAALPRAFGRAPSVVLVPVGALGMVPWHAARTAGRRGVRHACQDAQISYLPSARLLCELAARPAPPATATGRRSLVVGDPTGNLRHAAEEAAAIRAAFCPEAELLDDRTGTPEAVWDWLRRQRGGLLHLACHGVVRHGERHSSYLALAGGRLTAEELTEGADRYPDLGLVVLAACSTNVSGRGYDEAYSLATAFLVAGARSVLGSLWTVPDEATSLLMYMAHHFMHRAGLAPGAALRRAQLWMLDGGREVPAGMPRELADRVPFIDARDLAGWAGFTHLGW